MSGRHKWSDVKKAMEERRMRRLTRENTNDGTETHLIRCTCSTHVLQATIFEEDMGDPQGGLVYVGFLGIHPHEGRLRSLWHVLRHGGPPYSEVVLEHDAARELGEILQELADKIRDGEEA